MRRDLPTATAVAQLAVGSTPRHPPAFNATEASAAGWVVRARTLLLFAWMLSLITLSPGVVRAHLMQAQRGTLNLVGDAGFMVLALPASAFGAADLDRDGKLSASEFQAHRSDIHAAVSREVALLDDHGPRPLHVLMLSTEPPDNRPDEPAAQVIVLGRFALARPDHLRFHIGLFGRAPAERSYQITVTRRATAQSQLLVLTPDDTARAVFPTAWAVFRSFVALGVRHIVGGLDHLLFLLAVLSAGWSARQVLMGLTVFTVGHAITLVASVMGGLDVSPKVVEPTIAATIVGMVAFDIHARRRGQRASLGLRLALLFGCSLVHGLGLSRALTELGIEGQSQAPSLAGFNVGIELGQVAVALLAALVALVIRRAMGSDALRAGQRATAYVALAAGCVWFVQRIAESVG